MHHPSPPPPAPLGQHFVLDPGIAFLNHGSFGACPREVLDEQSRLRERLEREPVVFFQRHLEGLLDQARAALAAFVGAEAQDLAFVANATSGVNAVVRSLALAPGDELLRTDHAYGACANALAFAAERAGARVVVARVPFPIGSPEEVEAAVLAAASARTRLALLDHVTSPTGLVFPIARLVAGLAERGIDTLVDGAHAPGMLPLDLRGLGAAYYAGNCHKWLCAPKGAGFVHVRRDRQAQVRPTVISHGATSVRRDRSRFLQEFDWTGTSDPTAVLCIPTALRCIGGLRPGGWPDVMRDNHALAMTARRLLCEALAIATPAPESMVGSLASVPLPPARPGAAPAAAGAEGETPSSADPLQDALLFRFGIEVPVVPWPGHPTPAGAAAGRLLRISAQLYNSVEQFEYLARTLATLV